MTSLVLAYTTVGATVLERGALALMLLPWVVLLERWCAGRRQVVWVRLLLVGVSFDRLMGEYPLWSGVCCLLVGCWAVWARHSRGQGEGAGMREAMKILFAAVVFASLTANYGELAAVRWGVCAWVFVALYVLGVAREDSDEGARRWRAIVAVTLIVGTGLFLSLDGLERWAFLPLLVIGGCGWVGLEFRRWRGEARGVGIPVALLIGFLPLSLIPLETYFRFVYDASDANANLRTCRHWHRRHVQLNEWGYRDVEFEPMERFDESLRIVLLGDSFAFGQGIDERADLLNVQLERALGEAGTGDRAVRVFNLAHWGIDTQQETEIFLADGVSLRPHAVVLVYCFNDISKAAAVPHKGHLVLETYRPLAEASDFLEFFIWHVYIWGMGARSGELEKDLDGYQDAAMMARHREELAEWVGAVRGAGAKPICVLYPDLGPDGRSEAQRRATSQVVEALEALGVATVDAGALADVRERKYRANPFDWHPGAALHAAVVPRLARVILDQL